MSDVTQGQDVAAAPPPDVDDLFPKQDVDELFPADYKPTNQVARNVSPIQDMIFSNPGRSHARVLDAFGYGFKQGWGAAPQEFSEADDALRKAGIYNDYAKGQHNIIKAANEAVMRPAVAALLTVKGALSGAFSGAQAAVAQEGEELGAPNVGRELASLPEAFPAGLHQAAGIPHLPEPIAQAKALDVIGAGEGGYFGTKPVVAETPQAVAEAAKAQDIAKPEGLPGHDPEAGPSPVAQPAAAPVAETPAPIAPDIHTVARQIAPETFSEFDALSQKKDTFRRWIDELREVRDQTAREGAPHADEIADLQQKLTDATPRLAKKYQARLDPLVEERDAYIADHTKGDSADMAKIRAQLMQADYRQRDLAPDVSKAYRAAQERMPQAEAAETPAAEAVAHEPTSAEAVPAQVPATTEAAVEPVKAGAAASEAPSANTLIEGSAKVSEAAGKQAVAPTEPTQTEPEVKAAALPIAHAPSIVADVSQKLKAAGRPAAEADAAAQVVAAYWETRAQRFEGAKGTAAEMYAHEAPDIVAAKEKASKAKKARELELAQSSGLKEFDQAAYHGSPYDFDVFDTGKIGTGEGAASYGHGLYFAENERVAKGYQSALGRDPEAFRVDGHLVEKPSPEYAAAAVMRHMGMTAAHAAEKLGDAAVTADVKAVLEKWAQKPPQITSGRGNLYHVDIKPEPHEFLQWDKPLAEQQQMLKALEQVTPKPGWLARQVEGLKVIRHEMATNPESTGAQAYGALSRLLGGDNAATNALRDAGVPGIRYLDQGSRDAGEGTHNYVVFDPKDIEILDKNGKSVTRKEFEQNTSGVKGRIRLREDGRSTITLMKNADASTFIHETGHEWLERMLDDARDGAAPEGLKSDAATVLKWLGVDSPDGVKTRHHEKFARGFETYMLEGRAPSSALAKVFAKFKDWLTTIYKTVAALKAPISDDIRGVFDRLLAEKPEKTVIAPERATAGGLGERHEALVEPTAPERAHEVANTIEGERDSNVDRKLLENGDNDTRLGNTGTETEERAARGAQPSGHADAAGPVGGEAGAPGGSGEVGGGGSEAAAEGAQPRQKSERLNTAPTPLLRFIASKGGIKASDELITDLRQSLGASNRLIPGFGQLIRIPKQLSSAARKAGRSEAMSIDRAREAAIEAGHLPEGTTITQFLDAIDNEVRGIGNPMERPHDPAEQAHAEHSFVEGLNDEIRRAGGSELSDAERRRALEIYQKEGIHDPHDIIERLALEAHDAEIEQGAPERAEGVPGWDVAAPGWDEIPADSRAASDHGASAAPAESGEPRGAAARSGGQDAERHPLDATADLPKSETQLIDKAGNIRLDNLGTPEDVSAVIRATAIENDDFIDARRGVLPDAEVLKLADALGMSPEKIADRKLGQAFNAEQIIAARKLLIQSAGNVRDLAAKIAGGTEADVLAYAEARARHLMIQEQVSGITAEAGRALRAFRSLEGSKEAADISAFLQNTQGKTLYQMKEEGALLAMMDTPQQVSKAVHEASLTTYQKVRAGTLSWFINNLISGPITHAGYSVGNTVVQLFKATVDTTAAAAYGAIRDLPAGERVYFGEVGAQLYGMVRGMRDGYSPALTALKTGVPFMKGDVEGLIGQIEGAHRPQAIPGKIGYVMEGPSRAVTAIHTMHYSMNYEAEIARRAYRSAMKDDLEPGSDAFNTKIADFTQSPPQAEMEAAHDEALKMVLMKSAQFGTAQYHLQRAVNSNILAKIVMPFMQVGANILHESFVERTPLGFASQAVRDNLSGKNGPVAQHSQAARISVGIGISTAVIGLTAEGILTGGGPSDPKQLAIKEMTGWRKYSIRVGESYVPYRKFLGGLGPLIAGTADMYEVGHALNEEGLTKAAASSLFGFAEVIADESWAKGLSNFIDAARHWDRDGGRYLRNLAADFIPMSVGLSQITNVADPYRREVRTMLDVARAHIPGMSQGLFPVRDIWGEPILSHTALGASQANHDPATQSLLDAGYYPGRLERKIRGVELSGQQYDDFTRIAGRMARMRVNALVNTPGIAQMPKQIRADKIKDIIESARESARSMILMQNPEIIAKAVDAKKAKLTGAPVH